MAVSNETNFTPKQQDVLLNRRTLRRGASSPEGEAALRLLDADIAQQVAVLKTAFGEEVYRAQGAIKALEKYRRYLTEDPMIDR